MEICRVSVSTDIDGERSGFICEGKMQTHPTGVRLEYEEKNAKVAVELKNGEVFVRRESDYTLSLLLKGKEKTPGSIGISGSTGEIFIYTHEIFYQKRENVVKLNFHYDLLFVDRIQKMRLSLLAKPI